MPHTVTTSASHHSHSQGHKDASGNHITRHKLEPTLNIAAVILMLLLDKLLHANLLPLLVGALGIILLSISKKWSLRAGVFISIMMMFAMVMLFVWQWVDTYILAVISGELVTKPFLFTAVLAEGLTIAAMFWIYHRMIDALHLRLSEDWFVKKTYLRLFKMIFYFQIFLILFWIMAFILQQEQTLTRLTDLYTTAVAAVIAFTGALILAVQYLSKGFFNRRRRHRQRHHRSKD